MKLILFITMLLALATPVPASVVPAEPPMGGDEEGQQMSYLGVDTRDVTADRVGPLKLKEERGVEITVVDQDAPAGKAGLKEADVILEFNGQRVEGVEQFRRMIRETPPGRTVTLGIMRDGQGQNVQAVLADKHKLFAEKFKYKYKDKHRAMAVPAVPPVPPMPPMPPMEFDFRMSSSSYGLQVENLTPQLGEYFGVKNGEGVLVRAVEKGSPAETAGFRAGDIIIRVDKERILDRGDWRSAMRRRTGKVSIGVMRNKAEQTLSLELPKGDEDSRGWRFEFPDLDFDFDALEREIAAFRPEFEATMREALQVSREEARKAMRQARDQARKEMQKAREELRKAQREHAAETE